MANTNYASLEQNTTLVIDGHLFSAFANEDYIKLSMDADISDVIAGASSTLGTFNSQGRVGLLQIRVPLASEDDIYLNTYVSSLENGTTKWAQGSYSKSIATSGSTIAYSVTLENGLLTRAPDILSSSSANPEQVIMVYNFKFGKCTVRNYVVS